MAVVENNRNPSEYEQFVKLAVLKQKLHHFWRSFIMPWLTIDYAAALRGFTSPRLTSSSAI